VPLLQRDRREPHVVTRGDVGEGGVGPAAPPAVVVPPGGLHVRRMGEAEHLAQPVAVPGTPLFLCGDVPGDHVVDGLVSGGGRVLHGLARKRPPHQPGRRTPRGSRPAGPVPESTRRPTAPRRGRASSPKNGQIPTWRRLRDGDPVPAPDPRGARPFLPP
jgi:hypothetical protein